MRVPRHTYTEQDDKWNKEESEAFYRAEQCLPMLRLCEQMIDGQPSTDNAKDYSREGSRIERISQREP